MVNDGYWDNDLMCHWLSVEALPPGGIIIKLPEMHCVDFNGALRFAKKLVSDVDFIETWSGERKDTCYGLDKNGFWVEIIKPIFLVSNDR
jgi:hypothetical protein